jgi:hypothetical protein
VVVFGASSDAILLFAVIRARKTKPALSLRMVSRETDTQPLIGWLVRGNFVVTMSTARQSLSQSLPLPSIIYTDLSEHAIARSQPRNNAINGTYRQ